jgi:hypothetical protein
MERICKNCTWSNLEYFTCMNSDSPNYNVDISDTSTCEYFEHVRDFRTVFNKISKVSKILLFVLFLIILYALFVVVLK